ncbi:glucosamine--fructose-6-phosphate aminotransferase (isomerizing) [Actinoalloteichus hoggarensis]|uniref:Glutamine--fructose-6-phosphate aminotransferase [isomerizing] n=1 Tax=Actinoalloteichus hoggarensis TaxID=1470176 RepID=A0A221VWY0_9PSEU|nr:SIS domain-containing protein [Actinoalloteichus hoggarensis]ASO18056.1 Glutamine--fructose-6-phosphate aminotransferase [isomerizing] [Actinoalloteichus hoggarensis]MBB5921412.1 glucosamine--fructose-6-phosphate aminotransferase (isomerizing) [Actinoalloteichus hoggarensis]
MTDSPAGRHISAEIDEQPAVFARLLAARAATSEVASVIARRRPRFALLAARGSSDHAALYAKYLIEVLLELPAGLVSPSTTTLYGARPDLGDVLLITVSQSGGSPDLVEVTERARAAGALTVAVTNTAESDLSGVAELGVDVQAGPEVAVAATKTYSATLLALYLLVDAVRGGSGEHAAALPDLAAETLADSVEPVAEAVRRWRFVDRVVTTGRGFSSATAAEAALKLAETSYLSARSYSGADLLHGPVAAVDEETAVLAVAGQGAGGTATSSVLDVVGSRGADVVAVGSAAHTLTASVHIGVPATAEEVAPVIEVLPVQRLALGLSVARGFDPDRPRGLNKVTKTR